MISPKHRIFDRTSYYHLSSRTYGDEPLIGDRDKEFLQKLMVDAAIFTHVRVITYAILPDRIHLLVEVPPIHEEVTDEQLVERYRALYPVPTQPQPLTPEQLAEVLKENGEHGKKMRAHLMRRQHNPSMFMKSLKQRFTSWFNDEYVRYGPVWGNRYGSVLVEDDPWPLQVVAAYLDLAPVRDGLVKKPGDYAYSGYGQAKAGNPVAIDGYTPLGEFSDYELLLSESDSPQAKALDINRERLGAILSAGTVEAPINVALRCNVRYFTDGMMIGSPDFIEEQVKSFPIRTKKERKPHPMIGADWKGLCVGTGLKQEIFS
ncbi:MAG: transposase [Puniceicoccales bacterium]